jgi:S-DNA-T family DNA segregation ATPase FtsK/SpoIIIE
MVEELEDTKKLLSQIEFGEREKPKDWKFPPLDILQKPPKKKKEVNEAEIDKKIKVLLEKLKQFKIEGDVVRYYVGPVVTTFEFKPLPHIKVSKILALQDDLAMALKAKSIRIQAPIPGKDVVGIEIPNEKMETIYLREILESDIFKKSKSPLTLALGKDIVGAPFVTDLAKLPHLLIAGTTGSGKSVGINAMILSLLYKNSPDELKFVMIDPKMLEFSIYEDIPHLLTPVITESKKAIVALNAMVKEMERRYKLMAKKRVKNIENYNKKVQKNERLPYIVIIIDELADLMMTSGKDVEYAIARLAQMARASGIHLIVATQRPSVDVVTGLIKANLPSRISFKVGQKIDSKVILDQYGAESLLGRGDMLFTPPGITGLLRLHAPFTSEEEIEKVVEFLKSQREVEYDNSIINTIESESENLEQVEDLDELFDEAKEIILKERRTSISYLQRRLQIGYNRAANIIEQMERMGILSPPNAKGQREILV